MRDLETDSRLIFLSFLFLYFSFIDIFFLPCEFTRECLWFYTGIAIFIQCRHKFTHRTTQNPLTEKLLFSRAEKWEGKSLQKVLNKGVFLKSDLPVESTKKLSLLFLKCCKVIQFMNWKTKHLPNIQWEKYSSGLKGARLLQSTSIPLGYLK